MFLFRSNREVRPLSPVATAHASASVADLQGTPFYQAALSYFGGYPARSLMSDDSRAVLFSLIRMRRPTYIAEIGTFLAGTTEVLARACWENNWGIIYTTDPFGAKRCPPIIGGWPKDLRKYVSFHALTSMDFFDYLRQREVSLDFTLVDGDHDYECALFDLQMAARRTRPSGIVVMDNAEQSGPFNAARTFLSLNPEWSESGSAIADHDASRPFDASRTSLPGTSFIILQGPPYLPVDGGPRSWGQVPSSPFIAGITLTLAKAAQGTLHYLVTLRGFATDAAPTEAKAIGHVQINTAEATAIGHKFDEPLRGTEGRRHTAEIDLSWEGDPPLALIGPPNPMSA